VRIRRLVVSSLAVIVALAAVALVAVYLLSERRISATYDFPSQSVVVPTDAASVARGEHIVQAIGTCVVCHGEDSGGAVYSDVPFVGIVAGPNLTKGRGGIGGALSDEDWVRALRHGVRGDGTSLIAMPSEVFTHFSDDDLGAVVAYLKQLPPVDREVPSTRFRFGGRILLVLGQLNILTAPKTRHEATTGIAQAPTAEYGAYLARIGGCAGCHGYGLSGGRVAGPPDLPLAANITRAGIGSWTEADFVTVMRSGRRPDGRMLDEFMPWRQYGQMSDLELHALWLYLESVPARETGNK